VYDGKIILIIEGLENFLDQDTGLESNIKFWLPRFFPSNIRVITTAAKNSKSYKHLKGIGCKVIELRADPKMMQNKLMSLKSRKFFCSQTQKDRVFDILEKRVENQEISSLFMKISVSCFSPYASTGIVSASDVEDAEVQDILASVDLDKIEMLNDAEELIMKILDYFEDKIIAPEKYKKVFETMSLTFKGLTLREIMKIVSKKKILNFYSAKYQEENGS
jgi:hypothetical protein